MPASRYTVSDVMTHTAVAIGREASYKEIVELMHEWKVSAVPVLEGEGRVVGVVCEADLLPKEEFRRTDPALPDQLERPAAGPGPGPPPRTGDPRGRGCRGRPGGAGKHRRCLAALLVSHRVHGAPYCDNSDGNA